MLKVGLRPTNGGVQAREQGTHPRLVCLCTQSTGVDLTKSFVLTGADDAEQGCDVTLTGPFEKGV